MSITVLYFASLRERLGRDRDEIQLPAGTVRELIERLKTERADLASVLETVPAWRVAVNQSLASQETALTDGDEVALFPPVTGG